jgi:transcription initiation factor TFIID subunit 8
MRFNLPTDLLRPHHRTPIPRTALAPSFHLDTASFNDVPAGALPLLSEELSGQHEKDLKQYIPKNFPEFPSLHTYRYTPADNPGNIDVAAPGRIREAAAKSAKEGEDALRKLVRAAKIRNQKEARTVADRDVCGRERYRLWDGAMKGLLQDLAPPVGTEMLFESSADQGMIVNSDTAFSRREVARGGKRAGAGAIVMTNGGKVAG